MNQDGHYYTVTARKDAETPRRKRRSSFASSTPVPPGGGDSDFSDGDSGHPLDDDEEHDDLHNRTHSSVSHRNFYFRFTYFFEEKTCLYLKTIATRWGVSFGVAESGHSLASS